MTSRRRKVIYNGHHFYFVTTALVHSMIPLNLVKISQETKKVYWFANLRSKNDKMTSQRRYVIENRHHFYFLRCALVQPTIPPNLVRISQQTKKFIGLQICALK